MKLVTKGLVVTALAAALLSGCGGNNEDEANKAANNAKNNAANNEQPADEKKPDVVTTASIVNDAEAFKTAISEKGTWIVAILNDLTVQGDIVVAGQFHDKNDQTKDIYRKLALYSQDENRKITASYTLTVPKMTVQSENFKIHGGTVKGDVYVEAKGFNLDATATIDGNIHYASEEVKASAVIDGKVTGSADVIK